MLLLKQQFNELINEKSQTNRDQNRTYYFYKNMINLENFDSNLSKIHKQHYQGIDIYYVGYITIKKIDNSENIHGVNPLYLLLIIQVH